MLRGAAIIARWPPSDSSSRSRRSYRLPGAAFGVRPSTAWVEVDDSMFKARYGPWRVTTPLANITGTEVTGPYAYPKTAGPGPPRDHRPRALVHAERRPRPADPLRRRPSAASTRSGLMRHPELTVGVAEPERLAEAIASRTRPGT